MKRHIFSECPNYATSAAILSRSANTRIRNLLRENLEEFTIGGNLSQDVCDACDISAEKRRKVIFTFCNSFDESRTCEEIPRFFYPKNSPVKCVVAYQYLDKHNQWRFLQRKLPSKSFDRVHCLLGKEIFFHGTNRN